MTSGKTETDRSVVLKIGEDNRRYTKDLLTEHAATANEALTAALTQLRRIVLITLLIGLALIVVVSLGVSRSITRPIATMVTALRAVAGKDFTRVVDVTGQDEIAQMGRALNESVAGVRAAMTEFDQTARGLTTASTQLSTVSEELETGAQATATLGLDSPPPFDTAVTISVEVKAVPGEQKTDNNKAEYDALFSQQ